MAYRIGHKRKGARKFIRQTAIRLGKLHAMKKRRKKYQEKGAKTIYKADAAIRVGKLFAMKTRQKSIKAFERKGQEQFIRQKQLS